MKLQLVHLPALAGPKDDAYRGQVPIRMRYMAPDAAAMLVGLEAVTGGLVFTDIFRSAESSFGRWLQKPSATKRPGYSPHGYGLSFDLDVGATLRKLGIRYPDLIDLLATHGFYCHRRDLDPVASESWHFNFYGDNAERRLRLVDPTVRSTWDDAAEAEIVSRYGAQFKLSLSEISIALTAAGFDPHEGAGAVRKFQKKWGLDVDGDAGEKTQRTLAYVTAQRELLVA